MAKFKVMRGHQGERFYSEGEVREGNVADLNHLVPHVLVPLEEKAEPAPLNKALFSAPENKAVTGRKAKQKASEADQGEIE